MVVTVDERHVLGRRGPCDELGRGAPELGVPRFRWWYELLQRVVEGERRCDRLERRAERMDLDQSSTELAHERGPAARRQRRHPTVDPGQQNGRRTGAGSVLVDGDEPWRRDCRALERDENCGLARRREGRIGRLPAWADPAAEHEAM